MTARYLANTNRCYNLILPLLVVTLFAFPGCKQEENLGRIGGKVTFQGQPVSEGMVLFSCIAKGVNVTAPLKADGSYEVIMAKGAGLPLGEYKVSLSPPQPFYEIGEKAPPVPKQYPNSPAKYRNFQTSGLSVNIINGDNPFNIEMNP